MNGEVYPVKLELVDLWLDDNFLKYGLCEILKDVRLDCQNMRYVMFSASQYANVTQHNYDLRTHRFILLSDGQRYNFLDSFTVNHISSKASIEEIVKFLTSLRKKNEDHCHIEQKVKLSTRETTLLDQMTDGKKIIEMAENLNVHIKTVYQMRTNLIKKLGCSGNIDFMQTLRTDVFKRWLTDQRA